MKWIKIPIFETRVYLFKDPDEFNDYLQKHVPDFQREENIFGITGGYEDQRGRFFIAVCIACPKEELKSTLLHESSHITDELLKNAGIQDKNGEIDAYLLEYVNKRISSYYL